MEYQEKWQEQIDRYLKQMMSAEEENVFMEKVNGNEDLARELALQQELYSGVRTYGNRKLKSKLKNIHLEVVGKPAKNSAPSRRIFLWVASAAAIGLLLFCIFKFTSSASMDAPTLFAQYYEPFPLSNQSRDGESNAAPLEGVVFYKQKKYNQAIPEFNGLLNSEPNNTPILLALGICYLELNQLDEAVQRFRRIQSLEDPFLSDRAQWYEALAYLKNNQLNFAEPILLAMSQDVDHDYQQEAQAILASLQ